MWTDWEKGKHEERSQSEEDMKFFPCADCSKCLKVVFLAGCLLKVRSLLPFSQPYTNLLLTFSKLRKPFSLSFSFS
ncbi:hypothetical protein ACRRTK_005508 [Alexandromys fortis]